VAPSTHQNSHIKQALDPPQPKPSSFYFVPEIANLIAKEHITTTLGEFLTPEGKLMHNAHLGLDLPPNPSTYLK
jgi:hypothetical protein